MHAAQPMFARYQDLWKPFLAMRATQTAVQTMATTLPGISITDS